MAAIACVVIAAVVSVVRLFSDALPGQQNWATLNSQAGYAGRTFPSEDLIGSAFVAEDARLWIPLHGRYRIVVGAPSQYAPILYTAPNFLKGFLLPRVRDDSPRTRWVFCVGCDLASLGPGFHVLSDGRNGTLFGRLGR